MTTFETLVKASALVFVVSSMPAMGLGLSIAQIVAPLKKVKFGAHLSAALVVGAQKPSAVADP